MRQIDFGDTPLTRDKTLLIGIDSVHSCILRRAVKAGLMPELARFIERGREDPLQFEIGLSRASWASLHTGASAGRHGAYAFEALQPGSYRLRIFADRTLPLAPFWRRLSEAGLRVLIMNPSELLPVSSVNGLQVGAWRTHLVGHYYSAQSEPKDLLTSLDRQFPIADFEMEDWGLSGTANPQRYVRALTHNIQIKTDAFIDWMGGEHWDHAYVSYDDLHVLFHNFWGDAESTFFNDAGDEATKSQNIVTQSLAALDRALGQLFEAAGLQTNILIVALNGIGRSNNWSHMVDRILGRLEGISEITPRSYWLLRHCGV